MRFDSSKTFLQHKQAWVGQALVPWPILIYWTYWTLHPSYWFNADPAALYFIDSLAVFNGGSYVYVDHPGTPMQIMGTLLLALAYPFFDSRQAFLEFFLARPGIFFFMANVLLLAANVFCALYFYRTVYTALTKHRLLAALSLPVLFFALHPHGYPSLTFWSHNSLNYPIGTLLLLWLYRELRQERLNPRNLFLLGLASAILTNAQMYFVAWPAGALIMVLLRARAGEQDLKRIATPVFQTGLGILTGLIAMLIPIYKEVPRFAQWLGGIISHLGLYGSGEPGIYSLTLVQASLMFWWANIRPMILLVLLTLVLIGVLFYWARQARISLPAADQAMLIGLLLQTLMILILMTKAALKLRYSLSLAAIVPVLVFVTIKALEQTRWKLTMPLNLFYGLTLMGVILALPSQFEQASRRARVETEAQAAKVQAVNRLVERLKVPEEEIVVVYAYSVPLKCAGLLQASNWTGYFRDELAALCPNQHAIWDSTIELNSVQPMKNVDDYDWDLVIWPGNGTDLPTYLYAIGAVNIPTNWHVPKNTWFFIRAEVAGQ